MNQQIVQPAINEIEKWFLEAENTILELSEGLTITPEFVFTTKNGIEVKIIAQRKSTQSYGEINE